MELTQTMKDKYMKNGGNICPYCNSSDISGGKFNADNNSAWRSVECNICGKEWDDIYTLVDIE